MQITRRLRSRPGREHIHLPRPRRGAAPVCRNVVFELRRPSEVGKGAFGVCIQQGRQCCRAPNRFSGTMVQPNRFHRTVEHQPCRCRQAFCSKSTGACVHVRPGVGASGGALPPPWSEAVAGVVSRPGHAMRPASLWLLGSHMLSKV